ncbi:MAG: hypothetical protein GY822_09870 [Deltaproteobacteria bacterium]|nr:hypothetical protein [Deltaproteobacteria bacterium]
MAKKRVLISHKDLQIAFLLEGVDGVQKKYDTGNVSKATLRRTIKSLADSGKDAADLERWYAENFGTLGRGRGAPTPGESRSYKVQQIRRSGPFLRLPLDSLGVKKGDTVRVKFEDNTIGIEK